jgi:hypothetical protein
MEKRKNMMSSILDSHNAWMPTQLSDCYNRKEKNIPSGHY